MEKTIFEKEYGGDDISDIFEDIHYEIENANLGTDEYGMFKGTFSVKITHKETE